MFVMWSNSGSWLLHLGSFVHFVFAAQLAEALLFGSHCFLYGPVSKAMLCECVFVQGGSVFADSHSPRTYERLSYF